MSRLLTFGVILSALVLVACGGGGGNTITNPGGGNGGSGGVNATQVDLLASSPQLLSDQSGGNTVTLTAIVKDTNNTVVEGAIVQFGASSGELTVPDPQTNSNGIATATLGTRDARNRVITVTATVTDANQNTTTDTVLINVSGTTLEVTGPTALAIGQTGTYSVVLADSKNVGVPGQTVSVTSQNGNTLSASSLTTGSGGQTSFDVTATTASSDVISTSALGLTTTNTVNVSDDDFQLTSPTAGAEPPIDTDIVVEARWEVAGVAQAGETIDFSSTRGTFVGGSSATTDGSGVATVTLRSSSAGPAIITATNPDGTSASVSIEFVATVPDTLSMQADPFTVPVEKVSQISAVLRDPNGNLVKNKVVKFFLTADSTGGSLSSASDTTDSSGTAQTTYTAGSQSSAQDGVTIRAVVQETENDPSPVEATVALTVAAQELFIVIGTGNDIFEPTPSLFAVEWDLIVTDVDGQPVPNKQVQVSVLSTRYDTGTLQLNAGGDAWVKVSTSECVDEDTNRNGILDTVPTDEDVNSSGKLEAGNVSSVAPAPSSDSDACAQVGGPAGPSATVTTNDGGFARTCVIYPQDHNLWVYVDIEAEASVSGTEFTSSQNFLLLAKADDLNDPDASPPGQVSPFGADADTCTDATP